MTSTPARYRPTGLLPRESNIPSVLHLLIILSNSCYQQSASIRSQYTLISKQIQHRRYTPDTLHNLGSAAGSTQNSLSMEMSKFVQKIPDDVLLPACIR